MAIFALTLVRHGETRCNKESITQGQQDTELSEQGIHQATLLGQRLQYEKYTHVFSSDLKRALKTCEIILQENKMTPAHITQDERLRERGFGIYEGQHNSHVLNAMRKAKKTFKPDGGETCKQVKARAKAFFDDLCQSLHQLMLDRDNNCLDVPCSATSRRRNTSSSTVEVFPDSPPTDNPRELNPGASASSSQHCNSGSTTSSTSGCSSAATDIEGESPEPESEAATHTSSSHHYYPADSSNNSSTPPRDLQHNCLFPPPRSPSQPIPPHLLHDSDLKKAKISTSPAAGEVHYGACPPNVSLSPIFERERPSTMSSVSSGRNSSFDDGDMIPMPLADILIVTHGGLLRELIKYFVNVLGCQIPGGKGYTCNVSPNTGISKFTVTLGDGPDDPPRLTCLTIYDQDHLHTVYSSSAPSLYESFALPTGEDAAL